MKKNVHTKSKKICTQKQKNDTPLETVLSKEEIETLKNEGLADK